MNIPRNEYPRPQLVRSEDTWLNLNGRWAFEIDNALSGGARGLWQHDNYASEITVPFVPESKASGIENVDYMHRVWYARRFDLPENFDTSKGKVILHFGAADYETQAWMNGTFLGEKRGGFTPFEYDVTEAVKAGENLLTLTCRDDVKDPLQPSGKQSGDYANHGCFYTRCTGIWQTVWLEYVPETYIMSVKMLPDVKNEKLDVTVKLSGNATVNAKVTYKGEAVAEVSSEAVFGVARFAVEIKNPKLWMPGAPELYDIEFTAGDDNVKSYFGMRDVEVVGNKFLINGKSVFQRLVLDQGYYPDGIYTARDEEEVRRDIELSMAAGFNGARMHMKIFEPLYIHMADKLGYLLWGEYPNWGLDIARPEAMDAMLPEWLRELERDVNSPAIIGWCPFNESWPGNKNTLFNTVYDVTKMFDPMRPIIDSSGWIHVGKTDMFDVHDYVQEIDEFKAHYDPLVTGEGTPFYNGEGGAPSAQYDGKMPYFVSEFGGAFWDIDAAVDNDGQESGNPWGYGDAPKSVEELTERTVSLCGALLDNPGVCGFCYTQFSDVMQEMNGLFSYDRRPKMDLATLHAAISRKAAIED